MHYNCKEEKETEKPSSLFQCHNLQSEMKCNSFHPLLTFTICVGMAMIYITNVVCVQFTVSTPSCWLLLKIETPINDRESWIKLPALSFVAFHLSSDTIGPKFWELQEGHTILKNFNPVHWGTRHEGHLLKHRE